MTGFVYFIQSGDEGLIKIGYSKDAERRLNHLKVGSGEELKLLRKVEADPHVERAAHRRFAHIRVRREWFEATRELKAYIESADLAGDLSAPKTRRDPHPGIQAAMGLLRNIHPVETASFVADRIDAPRRTVEAWLTGRATPTLDAGLRLIYVYGPEMAYALTNDPVYLPPYPSVGDVDEQIARIEELPDDVPEKSELLARAEVLRNKHITRLHAAAESYRRVA